MTPLCMCREEWVCSQCLKCGAHCQCEAKPQLIHRISREAVERYRTILRSGELTKLLNT